MFRANSDASLNCESKVSLPQSSAAPVVYMQTLPFMSLNAATLDDALRMISSTAAIQSSGKAK